MVCGCAVCGCVEQIENLDSTPILKSKLFSTIIEKNSCLNRFFFFAIVVCIDTKEVIKKRVEFKTISNRFVEKLFWSNFDIEKKLAKNGFCNVSLLISHCLAAYLMKRKE